MPVPPAPPLSPSSPATRWQHIVIIGGILMVALNLRAPITALAPLAERMHDGGSEAGLSRQTIGLMTTIPLVLFGVAGLWAGWIGRRIGFARALGVGLLVLAIGCLVRSAPGPGETVWRMLGTVLIGAGIALGNVLLPGVVKNRYPNHIGPLTSLYATGLNLGAAIGIAAAVPMANRLSGGWSWSLASWGLMALVTLVLWSPQLRRPPVPRPPVHPLAGISELIRNPRAWQVTLHMGMISLVFYSSVAWLPAVLQSRGLAETEAAHWVTTMQLVGCVASLVVPTLADRRPSQSLWAFACAMTSALSLVGILVLPRSVLGFAVFTLGLGLNASFGLVLLLIAVRSRDADTTASLSSMAQAVGYVLAAPGPWLVGWLSEATSSWALGFGLVAAVAVATAILGLYAGRAGTVSLRAGEGEASVSVVPMPSAGSAQR